MVKCHFEKCVVKAGIVRHLLSQIISTKDSTALNSGSPVTTGITSSFPRATAKASAYDKRVFSLYTAGVKDSLRGDAFYPHRKSFYISEHFFSHVEARISGYNVIDFAEIDGAQAGLDFVTSRHLKDISDFL